jgi:AmmeMemoRadiSam system protein B/AmmeMemoRadiSam system protein A
MPSTRAAAVAGHFYPADAAALREQVARCLEQADTDDERERPPKLLVVPHAGYVYSGEIAAQAYALLARWRERITRVVLLGPVHRVPVRGLAAPTVAAFQTPLGRVPIDRAALADLRDLPQVVRDDFAHAPEHSLEVQLPFLQSVLADFALLPLAVGDASPDEVAAVLERVWGGDETLIVISSDLSHYLPYAQAQLRDGQTVQRMLRLDTTLGTHDACGALALNGALLAAQHHGLVAQLLDVRNSGDTAGDPARVVGYAALAFDTPSADAAALGEALLAAARNAIASVLECPAVPEPTHAALARPGACFVTLHDTAGELRGCKGRIDPERSLLEDVRANAESAAFDDARFARLTCDDWAGLTIEVSVLGALRPLRAHREAEALRALRPGVDGLVLDWGEHRGTLLPQVWQQLPTPREFLQALKHKAGLARDFWAPDVRLMRFTVRKFEEPKA